jgi:hypothetical protein
MFSVPLNGKDEIKLPYAKAMMAHMKSGGNALHNTDVGTQRRSVTNLLLPDLYHYTERT